MSDNKIRIPSSGGGITRYFDDYKSSFELAPGAVIVLAVVIMVIIILLHYFGGQLIG